MARTVLLPCACGAIHAMKDPGRNVRLSCPRNSLPLIYECRLGDQFRLRGAHQDIVLGAQELLIGREPEGAGAAVALQSEGLSREHCLVKPAGSAYCLIDLGSVNGTFLNEQRLGPGQAASLEAGDLVRLADLCFRFVIPEPAEQGQAHFWGVATGQDPREAVAEVPDDLVGRVLGGFKIISVIAQGGMGRIYFAHQLGLNRQCVLKALLPAQISCRENRAFFLREIRVGSLISHPNVVAFLAAGEEDGVLFLAMEYFPGRSLREACHLQPMAGAAVVSVGRQAADALTAAEAAGVVHRDIKPGNVLIDDKGEVKLIDFGIAKALTETAPGGGTICQGFVGTPAYMSPEQINDPAAVDHLSDIYALGATLYFCLTGRPPYDGPTPMAVIAKVGSSFPRPSDLRPGVPPRLEAIVLKAMAAEPGDRFSTAAEMRQALEAKGTGEYRGPFNRRA